MSDKEAQDPREREEHPENEDSLSRQEESDAELPQLFPLRVMDECGFCTIGNKAAPNRKLP